MYAQKQYGSRHCFRCSLPLTDAASLNEGIGPICRKLDNALLARLIPSDMGKVIAAYKSVDPLTLAPETLDTFMSLEAAFRADGAATREDWRKEVKRIEWMLSHKQGYTNITALKQVVLSLGYVGIVALWSGEAATGLATVFCFDGRLAVSGPQNKAARIALKKLGGKLHPASADVPKPMWTVPANHFREFRLAIITHYPNFDGLLEAVEAAQAHVEALKAAHLAALAAAAALNAATAPNVAPVPAQAVVVVKSPAIVEVVQSGDKLKVKTPYRFAYICEIRQTAYGLLPRKWIAAEKVWEFPATHKAQVEALLDKHFGH